MPNNSTQARVCPISLSLQSQISSEKKFEAPGKVFYDSDSLGEWVFQRGNPTYPHNRQVVLKEDMEKLLATYVLGRENTKVMYNINHFYSANGRRLITNSNSNSHSNSEDEERPRAPSSFEEFVTNNQAVNPERIPNVQKMVRYFQERFVDESKPIPSLNDIPTLNVRCPRLCGIMNNNRIEQVVFMECEHMNEYWTLNVVCKFTQRNVQDIQPSGQHTQPRSYYGELYFVFRDISQEHPESIQNCSFYLRDSAMMPEESLTTPIISLLGDDLIPSMRQFLTRGGRAKTYHKYKNKKYKVRTGSRGGCYILVDKKRVYVSGKK